MSFYLFFLIKSIRMVEGTVLINFKPELICQNHKIAA